MAKADVHMSARCSGNEASGRFRQASPNLPSSSLRSPCSSQVWHVSIGEHQLNATDHRACHPRVRRRSTSSTIGFDPALFVTYGTDCEPQGFSRIAPDYLPGVAASGRASGRPRIHADAQRHPSAHHKCGRRETLRRRTALQSRRFVERIPRVRSHARRRRRRGSPLKRHRVSS